jgi:hypothetical protein
MAMLTNQRVLLVPRILLCKGRDSDALDRETHRGERSEQVTRNGRGKGCGGNCCGPLDDGTASNGINGPKKKTIPATVRSATEYNQPVWFPP